MFPLPLIFIDFSDKETSYKLSNLDEFDIGSYTCSGDGKKEYLEAGTHKVNVHVGLYDSNGKYLTTFTSKSARSISPGETRDGDLHLELNSIDASKVKDVKVSIKNIVRQ